MSEPLLYAADNRGVYIPQYFAESIRREALHGVDQKDLDTLAAGPDEEWYWDAWNSVLDNATVTDNGITYRLYQDGDLWLIPADMVWDDESGWFREPCSHEWETDADNIEVCKHCGAERGELR